MSHQETIQELLEIVHSMKRSLDGLKNFQLEGALERHNLYMKGCEQARKILGVTKGYFSEFKLAERHLEKRRFIAFDHGDLTVGHLDDVFASTSQLKSTVSAKKEDVDKMILKALAQLAGLHGEKPRKNDRLIVWMSISNPANPWPFSLTERNAKESGHGKLTEDDFQLKCFEQIQLLLTQHQEKMKKKGHHTAHSLLENFNAPTTRPFSVGRSTGQYYTVRNNQSGKHVFLRAQDLAFKINYPGGYKVFTAQGERKMLRKIVFNLINNNSDPLYRISKFEISDQA